MKKHKKNLESSIRNYRQIVLPLIEKEQYWQAGKELESSLSLLESNSNNGFYPTLRIYSLELSVGFEILKGFCSDPDFMDGDEYLVGLSVESIGRQIEEIGHYLRKD